MSFKPRVTYLNTGRLSFASAKLARLKEVDFVLITKDDYNMPKPDSPAFQAQTRLLFKNSSFAVYEVLK